jgi:hypothetical protein
MAPTTSNDDANVNDVINWRSVGSGKSNTPLRKGKQHEHGAPNAILGGGLSGKTVVKMTMAVSRQQ